MVAGLTALLSPVYGWAFGTITAPECASFDSVQNRYLVSSYQSMSVFALTTGGETSLFWAAPTGPIGNVIYRDTFYVVWGTSPGQISGLDLATGTEVMRVTLTGSRWPDGVTGDTSGNLWIADCGESSLYRLHLASRTVSKLNVPEMAASIQDVCFDASANRLILVSYSAASPIQAYDIGTGSVSTVAYLPYAYMDGIARDILGNYFVSGHLNGTVCMFDPNFSTPPVIVASNLTNPSNIGYNMRDSLLIITLFGADSLALIPFESYQDEDRDTIPAFRDNCPLVSNSGQTDTDLDGSGDFCDNCTDSDNDGFGDPGSVANSCAVDNCPLTENPDQSDADHDGVGNACCCNGARGNVNNTGIVDLSDLSSLVSYLTGGGYILPCPNEANVNAGGIVDLSDLSSLVSYLTGGGYVLPICI